VDASVAADVSAAALESVSAAAAGVPVTAAVV
jgi:hypothetical protein